MRFHLEEEPELERRVPMKPISSMLQPQCPSEGFPVIGKDGYAGEQDGSTVVLSEVYWFDRRESADEEYPDGVPDYVGVHWCKYLPGQGWEVVFGWFSNQPDENDGNPLSVDLDFI